MKLTAHAGSVLIMRLPGVSAVGHDHGSPGVFGRGHGLKALPEGIALGLVKGVDPVERDPHDDGQDEEPAEGMGPGGEGVGLSSHRGFPGDPAEQHHKLWSRRQRQNRGISQQLFQE